MEPSHQEDAEAVIDTLLRLPELAERDAELLRRGRFLSVECALGTPATPVYLTIAEGRPVSVVRGPVLMRSIRFSYRASPSGWAAHWQAVPKPGFHDILALTKRGEAVLEGDLQPFIANLQYFKDLLALPRSPGGGR